MSFSQCRNKRNTIFFFKTLKKFTSPANEFLLYKYRNNRKMNFFFFSNLKKCTSPANEFLLHKCRNKNKKIFFFKSEKMHKSFLMSFSYKGIVKKRTSLS